MADPSLWDCWVRSLLDNCIQATRFNLIIIGVENEGSASLREQNKVHQGSKVSGTPDVRLIPGVHCPQMSPASF